jgi:hypothetical protein
MYQELFDEFLRGGDTLRVYEGSQLVFSSTKDKLLPLLEYLERFAPQHQQVVTFDKIMGNAAALLSVKAGCRKVYSPLGSQLATDSLDSYGINYHLLKTVPYIQNADGTDMCPMEKLSLGKTPEEFYQIMRSRMK